MSRCWGGRGWAVWSSLDRPDSAGGSGGCARVVRGWFPSVRDHGNVGTGRGDATEGRGGGGGVDAWAGWMGRRWRRPVAAAETLGWVGCALSSAFRGQRRGAPGADPARPLPATRGDLLALHVRASDRAPGAAPLLLPRSCRSGAWGKWISGCLVSFWWFQTRCLAVVARTPAHLEYAAAPFPLFPHLHVRRAASHARALVQMAFSRSNRLYFCQSFGGSRYINWPHHRF